MNAKRVKTRQLFAVLSLLSLGLTAPQAQNTLTTLNSGAPQAATLADQQTKAGEALFEINCAPCHQLGAQGMLGLAPNLRNRDFVALATDDFIKQTIKQGRTGTAMVARPDLTDEQIDAIIAYLRSGPITKPVPIKVDWHKKFRGDLQEGKIKYDIYCSACHGPNGEGYSAGVAGTGIGLPGFLDAASDDFIFQTVKLGRIGTPMQPFIGPKGMANLSEQDVYDIIAHLRQLGANYSPPPSGELKEPDPVAGKIQFMINCVPCHQTGGFGKVGFAPSIRNRDFLALASDEFIKKSIRTGRPGTAMMARGDLTEQTVVDMIAYLRSVPTEVPVDIKVDPILRFSGDAEAGEINYQTYCSSCHGPNGEGYTVGLPGTSIGLVGFQIAASDDYIFQTLKHGRMGTPMKSFLGSTGLANLSETDAHDIIAFIRTMPSRLAEAQAETSATGFE